MNHSLLYKSGTFILFIFFLFTIQTKGEVKLPRLITNGMVLQRDTPLCIWGWADPSEKIKVEFQGDTFKTKADKKGTWKLKLPAYVFGGPYTMKINRIEIKDILIGDVWLSSGQSNMELPLRRVTDLYADEIKNINNSHIRLFRTSTRKDFKEPQVDFPDGTWKTATQKNIMEFSAVSFFFANELYQRYHVPIGIISTAIGGSPAESWLSNQNNNKYLEQWIQQQANIDSIQEKIKKDKPDKWKFNWWQEVNSNDPGVANWSENVVDLTNWKDISLPGFWSEKGVEFHNGSIWFCKEFDVEKPLANQEAILRLGRIIDSDSAFINGTFVGTTSYQYPPRIYNIPKGVLKAGKNQLIVRVFCHGGKGGFVVDKPYEIRFKSQSIDITGDWKYHIGAKLNPPEIPGKLQFRPGGLFNTLINPVLNYGLKGVIWFQGESNTGRGKEYEQLFKSLIHDWRINFHQSELPFLYAQLANLGIPNKVPVESGWADVREAQRKVLELPFTGMAVTFDIGEWNDIHPLKKKEVGYRLALEACKVAYHNDSIISSGPIYDSLEIKSGSIILTFTSVGKGLYTNNYLKGFQIAGDDGIYKWANAVVLAKNKVKVWNQSISKPQSVRYAWEDNPSESNLKNKEGLPASPFSTK